MRYDPSRGTKARVKLLAIDTATALCGVAVLVVEEGPERHAVRKERVTTHSERLLALIGECLAELGLAPAQLDAVVCSAGPGSFTGLRIGVATAKGLCFALDRPLLLVSSLLTLAEGAPRPALAVLDAGRGQVYARLLPGEAPPLQALWDRHPELLTDGLWQPDVLAARLAPAGVPLTLPLTLCDPLSTIDAARAPALSALVGQRAGDEPTRPLVLARLGLERLRAGEQSPLDEAVPNYICPSAAETKAAAAPPGA